MANANQTLNHSEARCDILEATGALTAVRCNFSSRSAICASTEAASEAKPAVYAAMKSRMRLTPSGLVRGAMSTSTSARDTSAGVPGLAP